MGTESDDTDFTPQEKQDRFLATIKGALKTPPIPRPTKGKDDTKDQPAKNDRS